jgi:F-type H+-transporting ATPase subunit b
MAANLATEVVLAAGGEPSPLLPHLGELIVGIVAFTLLFLFLRAKVFPVFEKTFHDRAESIEGAIAAAQKDRTEAQQLKQQYERQLAEARDEAGRIRTEAQAQRAEIVEAARAEGAAERQRIIDAGAAQIASERQQALSELRREVGTMAVDLASRIVGESLEDDARRRGTVDRYLDELDRTSARTAGTAS